MYNGFTVKYSDYTAMSDNISQFSGIAVDFEFGSVCSRKNWPHKNRTNSKITFCYTTLF